MGSHLQLKMVVVVLLLLAAAVNSKKTVYDDLLARVLGDEYNANAMPICNPGDRLLVGQDLLLYQLFDLDEPTQMLSVDVWIESTWQDCRLRWLPSEFNNVSEFAIKSEHIWYPDLIFYESLHGNFEEGLFIYGESTATVRHDGWVRLGNQALLKSFCRVDIGRFPFDEQSCNLTFSSWTKDIDTFKLMRKAGDKGGEHAFEKASNGEWEVLGFTSFELETPRRVGFNEDSESTYSEVVFQLRLRRKRLFYEAYMLFPCMLLAWLTAFGFALPTECGEKIAYSTTILLSLIVFLLLVADNIPRSGDAVPLLGVYFCACVCLVSMATIMTIASYNVGLRSDEFARPTWLTSCCHWLKPLLRLRHLDGGSESDGETAKATEQPRLSEWRKVGIVLDRICFIVYFLLNLAVTLWIMLV